MADSVDQYSHRTFEECLTEKVGDDYKANDGGPEISASGKEMMTPDRRSQIHRHRGDVKNRVTDLGEKCDSKESTNERPL
jgi:hypothetical protein